MIRFIEVWRPNGPHRAIPGIRLVHSPFPGSIFPSDAQPGMPQLRSAIKNDRFGHMAPSSHHAGRKKQAVGNFKSREVS